MTKIHFDALNKTEQWIICSLDHSLIDRILKAGNGDGLEINFTINGIEIPFVKLVERIEQSFNYNLEKEAKLQAVKTSVNSFEVSSMIYSLLEEIERAKNALENALETIK